MTKLLYISILCLLIVSCGVQRKSGVQHKEDIEFKIKPEIKHHIEGDYYTVNIGDISKNDNTISYGSIVSANPIGYIVTRNYFPSISQNFRERYIIIHYTALDRDSSIMALTEGKVSAHYLVNDVNDSEIYQLVDENKRAYHAGISSWGNDKSLNDTSIGIEIVNKGYVVEDGKKKFFPFPEYQFRKVASLVKDLAERYNIKPTHILGHSDIAPTRKQDPGPLFPWKKLYEEYGLGMWYDEDVVREYLSSMNYKDFRIHYDNVEFISTVQESLSRLGYGIEITGVWDDATKKTVEVFQYRFRPLIYDGVVDAETWAILQALVKKYIE